MTTGLALVCENVIEARLVAGGFSGAIVGAAVLLPAPGAWLTKPKIAPMTRRSGAGGGRP